MNWNGCWDYRRKDSRFENSGLCGMMQMEYTKLKYINQYKSKSINPAKTPDTIFEMYSVPIYATGHPEYLRGDEIASNKAIVRKNDILLCKINPRINRVWVVSDESGKQNIASSEWIVIRNSEYNPEFLAWYFRTPKFQKFMTSEITGIGGSLTRAQPKCVAEYPVPVLNRKKQDEIVNILDKCKFVIDSRKRELLELDNIIKARFVEMFGSIHESTGYPYLALKDLSDVISGGTPSRGKAEFWNNGTIPWVKTTELKNNVITDVDEYITEEGLVNSSAKLVPAGTILVAMYGQGKTRGMTAYLDIEASTNQACACILPSDKIDSMFMWKYFELSYDKLRSLAQGAGQPNLNGNMIKNFKVLVPPIEMQKSYVNFVNQVDKSKVKVQKALDETQKLFDSLMQQYFG